jgi:hypothetical protein
MPNAVGSGVTLPISSLQLNSRGEFTVLARSQRAKTGSKIDNRSLIDNKVVIRQLFLFETGALLE